MTGLPAGMVEGLAEVVLRVKDIDLMEAFYRDLLGLTLWRRFGDDMAFFKLSDTPGARPQTLALFVDRWPPNVPGRDWNGVDASATTMHHFALSLALPNLLKSFRAARSERHFDDGENIRLGRLALGDGTRPGRKYRRTRGERPIDAHTAPEVTRCVCRSMG